MMIGTLPRSSSASASICSMSTDLKVFCMMLTFWRITGSHFRKHTDQMLNCHCLPLFTHGRLQDPFALLKPGPPLSRSFFIHLVVSHGRIFSPKHVILRCVNLLPTQLKESRLNRCEDFRSGGGLDGYHPPPDLMSYWFAPLP